MFSSPRTDWGRGERQDIQSSDFARNNHTKESYVATPAPSLVDEGDQRTKGRVLVAEDKALIRLDIRSVLERRGWEICGEARDGREAVRLASDLRPDVTLIDVRMPGLDGVEATRLIQRERETPVVMMAAYDRPSLVARSILAGATSYVLKPFAEGALEAAIAHSSNGARNETGFRPGTERIHSSPKRDEIVVTAKHLFATEGYEATSIQNLADSVGLLKGSLYYHITSKQELLVSIVGTFLNASAAVRNHVQESGESAERRLGRYVSSLRALHALDPDGSAIARAPRPLRGTEMAGIAAEAAASDAHFLERLLVDGKETGVFRLLDEPARLATRVLDVVSAPCRTRLPDFGEIDREANSCAAFVLASLSGRRPTE